MVREFIFLVLCGLALTGCPASETITLVSPSSGCRARSSAARRSVSREAVPLPIATSSTRCARQSRASAARPSSQCRFGSCG